MGNATDSLLAYVYTSGRQRRGVLPVLGGTAVLRHNDKDTFTIDLDGDAPLSRRLTHGSHLALYDGDTQIVAGVIDKITRTMQDGITDVSVSGTSHMRYLSDTVTLPDPAKEPDQQNVDKAYKRTGPRETLITDLVRLNVGQGALASRRRAITVAASQGRGGSSSIESRFKTPLEEAQTLAKAGELGFRTWLDTATSPANVRFEVFKGRDLSRAVRLSTLNGALTEYTLEQEAPTVTSVLVGGQGEGAARFIRYRTGNTNDWGAQVMQFIDGGQTDDPTELEKSGDDALTEGQEKAAVSLTTVDLPNLRFGRHYGLGDKITVQLEDGVTVSDVVQSAEITWGESGREVKLQVGPIGDDVDAPTWVKKVRALDKKLRVLETR